MSRNILNANNVTRHLIVDGILTNILTMVLRKNQKLKNIFVTNVEEILNHQLDGDIITDTNTKVCLQNCSKKI